MTYGGSSDDRFSKGQRREVARDKARALRAVQKKKDRRNRVLLQGGVTLGVLAIVAVIVIIVASQIRPPSPGPRNMLSDGIKISQGFKAVPTAALQPGDNPVPSATNKTDAIDIRIFVDYQCPICGQFEKANASQIKTWVDSGAATIEIHPIAILDNKSLGAKYSTRAANSAACVANFSPNSYFDYNALLFAHQPKESTSGLTDKQLIALTKDAKVKDTSSIASCIKEQTFKSWVNAASSRAIEGPIPGTDVEKVAGTPTVIVNGAKYDGAYDDAAAFSAAIAKAAGDTFREDVSSTASPTPTPAP